MHATTPTASATRRTATRNVLVVGATGGSGRATVDALLAAGHRVTAFARSATRKLPAQERLTRIDGDATDAAAIDAAVEGQDVVVVALGISENPIRVRLMGTRGTPIDIRSRGTRTVIDAMQRKGVRRLVCLSSFGVGETRDRLAVSDRLLFELLLKPQIQDTARQEEAVRESDLDWVLAQPVHLTDAVVDDAPLASLTGETRSRQVARAQVGQFLAHAATDPALARVSVAISG